jgi:hypothetical protein
MHMVLGKQDGYLSQGGIWTTGKQPRMHQVADKFFHIWLLHFIH